MFVKCIDCVNAKFPLGLCFMENCQHIEGGNYCSPCPCKFCNDCSDPFALKAKNQRMGYVEKDSKKIK